MPIEISCLGCHGDAETTTNTGLCFKAKLSLQLPPQARKNSFFLSLQYSGRDQGVCFNLLTHHIIMNNFLTVAYYSCCQSSAAEDDNGNVHSCVKTWRLVVVLLPDRLAYT